MEVTRVVVPADLEGVRADRVVAGLTDLPRSRVRRLIEEGRVTVAGEPITPSQRLAPGTEVTVSVDQVDDAVVAEDVPFTVVYEDDDVLVVDKPAGVVVHPGAGVSGGTLVAGILARFPAQAELLEQRFGLVHRLDKDTSGLLLVARSAGAYRNLQAQLRRREVARTYLALVAGDPPAARGTIDAPIGRNPAAPMRMAVVSRGRAARTHYRRLAGWADASLLEVSLESGRTHQIRVHLAAVDLPVVGDRTYGRKRAVAAPAGPDAARSGPDATGQRHRADPGRQWLHAVRLVFAHPVDGDRVVVESPVPADLAAALTRLGIPRSGAVPSLAQPGDAGPGITLTT
ncbi:RluA family pseudouridine synthase [soil metagenome]